MADNKISDLPTCTLTTSDLIEVEQPAETAGTRSRKATVAQAIALALDNDPTLAADSALKAATQQAVKAFFAANVPTPVAQLMLSDMATDLTTGTGKAVWFAPEDGELVDVWLALHDPSSSGVVRVDMNDGGGSVFTTRPSIDATEATSLTGTAAVLDGTITFSKGDKFTFDIDDAGTDAKGLQVTVEYARL